MIKKCNKTIKFKKKCTSYTHVSFCEIKITLPHCKNKTSIFITGCTDGKFGLNCSQPCGFCTEKKQCHFINGICVEGCDSGYIGSLCVQSKNFIISKTYNPYSYTLTLYTHTHPFIHVIDIHNNIYFFKKNIIVLFCNDFAN